MAVRAIAVWIFAALWFALVLYGVAAYLATEPSDSGFTRGLNRIGVFFQWQLYALGAAAGGFFVSRRLDRALRAARLAGKIPLMLSGAFFLGVIALFVVTIIIARLA